MDELPFRAVVRKANQVGYCITIPKAFINNNLVKQNEPYTFKIIIGEE